MNKVKKGILVLACAARFAGEAVPAKAAAPDLEIGGITQASAPDDTHTMNGTTFCTGLLLMAFGAVRWKMKKTQQEKAELIERQARMARQVNPKLH